MATVTKLKAAVNNKNLPILGDDGNLYNYYVGRYTNKISELGYNLTNTEIQVLNTFIETGINDGWIDKIVYLLPFIGSEVSPLTGLVPLIDNIADYELAEDSVDSKLFSYGNGKIMCVGGRDDNANINAKIPLKTSQFGPTNCVSAFFNSTLDSQTTDVSRNGTFIIAEDNNSIVRFFCRKGSPVTSFFQVGVRETSESELTTDEINGANFEEPCNVGIYTSRYYSENTKVKRYVMVKGENSPRSSDMEGTTSTSKPIPDTDCDVFIGNNHAHPIKVKINLCAFINPINLTANDMYSFNQAVFSLITALGRDVPTI